MVSAMTNDLFAPDVIADPHSYFGHLRQTDPIHWNAKYEVWIITRYDDLVWVNRHPELFSSEVYQRDPRPPYPPIEAEDMELYQFMRTWQNNRFMHRDRPVHADMRKVVQGYFNPRAMNQWRPMITSVIQHLLDEVEANGQMDVVADFAVPMPLLIISEMMGIPQEDRTLMRKLAEKFLFLDSPGSDRFQTYVAGIKELTAYLSPLVAEQLVRPGEDLLSVLASGERHGVYTRQEVLANAILLLFAGHETTINLLCNGTLAFVRHPDQWELLRQDLSPTKVAQATEECLRYDAPVKAIQRIALQDVERRGKTIRQDDRVLWCISSANRDPEMVEAPDRFDISRNPSRHVSFGAGPHYCLGANLARLEGQEAFKALAQRLPTLHLQTEELAYHPSLSLRSLQHLPVSWS